jgi:hypothetical protein
MSNCYGVLFKRSAIGASERTILRIRSLMSRPKSLAALKLEARL